MREIGFDNLIWRIPLIVEKMYRIWVREDGKGLGGDAARHIQLPSNPCAQERNVKRGKYSEGRQTLGGGRGRETRGVSRGQPWQARRMSKEEDWLPSTAEGNSRLATKLSERTRKPKQPGANEHQTSPLSQGGEAKIRIPPENIKVIQTIKERNQQSEEEGGKRRG